MCTNQEDVSPGTELGGILISTAEGRNSALFLAVVPGAQSSARHIGDPPVLECGTNAWHPLCGEFCLLSAPYPWGTRSAAPCSEREQCFSASLAYSSCVT